MFGLNDSIPTALTVYCYFSVTMLYYYKHLSAFHMSYNPDQPVYRFSPTGQFYVWFFFYLTLRYIWQWDDGFSVLTWYNSCVLVYYSCGPSLIY